MDLMKKGQNAKKLNKKTAHIFTANNYCRHFQFLRVHSIFNLVKSGSTVLKAYPRYPKSFQ